MQLSDGESPPVHLILNQNCFQYNDKYFKLTKDIALGSPTSSTLAEIYLQFLEQLTIRHWMDNGGISYYRRYVDDIIIIFDQKNEGLITNYMNNICKYLEFKKERKIRQHNLLSPLHP